jgi:hypothetical protein
MKQFYNCVGAKYFKLFIGTYIFANTARLYNHVGVTFFAIPLDRLFLAR